MTNKVARIYCPFLSIQGGGEKYVLDIARIASERFKTELWAPTRVDPTKLERRFGVDLSKVTLRTTALATATHYIPQRWIELLGAMEFSLRSRAADVVVVQGARDFTPRSRTAATSIYIQQAPVRDVRSWKRSLFERLLGAFVDTQARSFSTVVVYSDYVKNLGSINPQPRLERVWPGVESVRPAEKSPIILSVGRFFVSGHAKKQHEMIVFFKRMHSECPNWELHLAGGVFSDAASENYYAECVRLAEGYPIFFHKNLAHDRLMALYGKAKIYWHAAGYSEDLKQFPERAEHFGITTVEAMGAGCVPIVFDGGGQREIVEHGVSGFRWANAGECREQTLRVVNDEALLEAMSGASVERQRLFSQARFDQEFRSLLFQEQQAGQA